MAGTPLEPTADQLERERYGPLASLEAEARQPTPRQPSEAAGGHDPHARKQATRKQREKGCTIYVTAELLERAGISPSDPPPFYRVWSAPRGRVVVQLYRTR